MALRAFTDPEGHTWEVWEAHAFAADRRLVADRRRTPRSTPERRVKRLWRWLAGPPTGPGWLVFRSTLGKWRLPRVPEDWEARNDASLYALLAKAARVPTSIESRKYA